MQKLVLAILKFLEKITGKRFVYLPKNRQVSGKTAVKTEEGFWYVGDVTDTHDLAYGILYHGRVEPEESGLVKEVLQKMLNTQKALNFYDIGAHTGYYSIMAAFLGNGTINTYVFEPLAESSWSLEQSARLNRLENKIKVFRIALGEKSGQAKLYVAGAGSTFHKNFLGRPAESERNVGIETLDDLAEKNSLPTPDFIKIDVEGYEFFVLKGAQKTIAHSQPVMLVEIAKTLNNFGQNFVNRDFENTFDLLSSWGYRLYALEGNKLLPVAKNYSSSGKHMFFCVPQKSQGLLKDIIGN